MDILITLALAVPFTAFITLFIVAVGRTNQENEIYMEGYNAGLKEGAKDEMRI